MSASGSAGAKAEGLEPFRRRLDEIDEQIAKLLGERLDICREVAVYKSEHEIPMIKPDRGKIGSQRSPSRGAEAGLPADFFASLFELLIATTCRLEDELM